MKSHIKLSTMICPKCGTKTSIGRKVGQLRESGHIKDMYCSTCGDLRPYVENPADKVESYWILRNIFNANKFVKFVRIYNTETNEILSSDDEMEVIEMLNGEGEFDSERVLENEKLQDKYNIIPLLHVRGKDTLIRKTIRVIESENRKLADELKKELTAENPVLTYNEIEKFIKDVKVKDILIYQKSKNEILFINKNSIKYSFVFSQKPAYSLILHADSYVDTKASLQEVRHAMEKEKPSAGNISDEVHVLINEINVNIVKGIKIKGDALILVID